MKWIENLARQKFQLQSYTTSHFNKKKKKKMQVSDNYMHVSAFKRWHNNSHSMHWDLKGTSAKAQRWQKCPQSLKIVDSVNKKCQLRWRVREVVCLGVGGVQNVDRDRKWPGNWTRNTNEPVSERRHWNSAEVSSLTLNNFDWSSGKANTYCVKPKRWLLKLICHSCTVKSASLLARSEKTALMSMVIIFYNIVTFC